MCRLAFVLAVVAAASGRARAEPVPWIGLPFGRAIVSLDEPDRGWLLERASFQRQHDTMAHAASHQVIELELLPSPCAGLVDSDRLPYDRGVAADAGFSASYFPVIRTKQVPEGVFRVACADRGGRRAVVFEWTAPVDASDAARASAHRVMDAVVAGLRERDEGRPQRLALGPIAVDLYDMTSLWVRGTQLLIVGDVEVPLGASFEVEPTRPCEDGARDRLANEPQLQRIPASSVPPPGFAPDALALRVGTSWLSLACLPRAAGGSLWVHLVGLDPNDAARVGRVRPLLVALGAAYGVHAAPPPPPPPIVTAAPPVVASASPPAAPTVEPIRRVADVDPEVADEDLAGRYLAIGFQHVTPTATASTPTPPAASTQVALALVRPAAAVAEVYPHLAWEGLAAISHDDHGDTGLEGRLALGYVVHLGALALSGVAGVGFDYLGGGSNAYAVTAAASAHVAGTLRYAISPELALQLRVARTFRSSTPSESDAALELALARPGHRKLVLAGAFRGYDDTVKAAQAYGLALGLGF